MSSHQNTSLLALAKCCIKNPNYTDSTRKLLECIFASETWNYEVEELVASLIQNNIDVFMQLGSKTRERILHQYPTALDYIVLQHTYTVVGLSFYFLPSAIALLDLW